MIVDEIPVAIIPDLVRIESMPKDEMMDLVVAMTKPSYSHAEAYGQFCPVQTHIAAPPAVVFDFMADLGRLAEWTYSIRDFRPTDQPEVSVARDAIGEDTEIYCKVVANREALTVDYHCAWDQGDSLWMIYLNRIVPAELVLGEPGSVVFWQNCRHPYYDDNPFPETAPPNRPIWVGDIWDLFQAGHELELRNLKRIVEHRYAAAEACR